VKTNSDGRELVKKRASVGETTGEKGGTGTELKRGFRGKCAKEKRKRRGFGKGGSTVEKGTTKKKREKHYSSVRERTRKP